MDERLLTPADVAARCQISAKSVLRAIHRGQLRAYRLGERGAYRLRECDVDAWLEQAIVTPPAPKQLPGVVPARERPTPAGRLTLTPDMGRSRAGRAA
jgi:excisionase family DNA binding protein